MNKPMNTWKPNLEQTKRHYLDWWHHKGLVLNMWEHFQEGVKPHADVAAPPAPRDLSQKWFDPQWRADYLDWYVAHSSLMADMLPVANTHLGPCSLAAILGGVFEGGDDTIWIHPSPSFTDDITFNPDHPNYLLHKDLLRASKAKAQGHYYVGMPDLMEGLDVLAALKGTDSVLLDTVMQPELVERQLQQINDIYFKVFAELYDIIREGDEMAFCYFSSWAPGTMSKLQSDISTMISEDDYRRFVQPYIREQCQNIDYTLYHLDGVGAVRHLPALLEIEELDAVQWTPGVGQPQGGSPEWYGLYRRILDAGKSVMACWVTLDELRPLLDNIGGEGVHIEMDFHNEREVEQALRIVEEYQHSTTAPSPAADDAIVVSRAQAGEPSAASSAERPPLTTMTDRIMVLDGAMGTMIQRYSLREDDFRGARFASHDVELRGCNDVLALTCPFVVADIHRKYLEAGADMIETNTFNAQRISMSDYHMQAHCREINLEAARLARRLADEFTAADPSKPRYVLGSIGPTSRTCSIATGGGEQLSRDELRLAYEEQVEALIDGGVDALLIETIFDVENARVALEAAHAVMSRKGMELPLMLSFSVSTPDGHNMLGQSIPSFLQSLKGERLLSVGINCVTDIRAMMPLVERLSDFGTWVSLYPNAGLPDANGRYNKTPQALLADVWPLLEHHRLNIIGGCCGTTDAHIRIMAEAVQPVKGVYLSPLSGSVGRVSEDVGGNKGDDADASSARPTSASEAAGRDLSSAERLFQAIVEGRSDDAAKATADALGEDIAPHELINGQMIRAMAEVGRRFQDGKAFVPQLLMAGRAMKAALELLKPRIAADADTSVGKVVIGTVKGDLHDIGKNLVASMLEGCGFDVVNIGIDVSADRFIEAVKENQPDILCMSALLTTTMGYMREVIEALQAAGIRERVKVMVGGAPVTQGFADEIGADGYSDNANSAVAVAKQLLGRI